MAGIRGARGDQARLWRGQKALFAGQDHDETPGYERGSRTGCRIGDEPLEEAEASFAVSLEFVARPFTGSSVYAKLVNLFAGRLVMAIVQEILQQFHL